MTGLIHLWSRSILITSPEAGNEKIHYLREVGDESWQSLKTGTDHARARYLKAETSGLFSDAKLLFERGGAERACLVSENQALYDVRPAKKKLG